MTLNGVVNSSSPKTGLWIVVWISWLPSESDPGGRNAPNVTGSFTHQSSWLAVDDVAVFTSIGGCNFGDLPLPRHALHVGITEILVQVSDPVRLLKESYAVGTENALAA
jgi:hypothetical protein